MEQPSPHDKACWHVALKSLTSNTYKLPPPCCLGAWIALLLPKWIGNGSSTPLMAPSTGQLVAPGTSTNRQLPTAPTSGLSNYANWSPIHLPFSTMPWHGLMVLAVPSSKVQQSTLHPPCPTFPPYITSSIPGPTPGPSLTATFPWTPPTSYKLSKSVKFSASVMAPICLPFHHPSVWLLGSSKTLPPSKQCMAAPKQQAMTPT